MLRRLVVEEGELGTGLMQRTSHSVQGQHEDRCKRAYAVQQPTPLLVYTRGVRGTESSGTGWKLPALY